MNFAILGRTLAVICLLVSASMLFSLPWALPALGIRTGSVTVQEFEWQGARALLSSAAISASLGVLLWFLSRRAQPTFYRKEAMAIVGLSWILVTFLGALPYKFADVHTRPDRSMTWVDALFESQSGFSTTGASVLTDLEDPSLVPHCILFWRSSTQFLGGLGIVVLFVAVLGYGVGSKAMMQAEKTGPTKEGTHARVQTTALRFAGLYLGLNVAATATYMLLGMTLFDAINHSFTTIATGGFSTHNGSMGQFSSSIQFACAVFMGLSGINFATLYFVCIARWSRVLSDAQLKLYLPILLVAAAVIFGTGLLASGTRSEGTDTPTALSSLFQVVSIMTTTGFATADFDQWNQFARGIILVLMFLGGCAGSTAGGIKMIRVLLLAKIFRQEIELSYRPNVVRSLQLGGTSVETPGLRKNILLYFTLIGVIAAVSWLIVIAIEPDSLWAVSNGKPATSEKLLDCFSAVAATLNNIGPGLGIVGPTHHYDAFSSPSKMLFVVLMILGRLEIFCVLVLLSRRFWRG